jgi:hypothetical protein
MVGFVGLPLCSGRLFWRLLRSWGFPAVVYGSAGGYRSVGELKPFGIRWFKY